MNMQLLHTITRLPSASSLNDARTHYEQLEQSALENGDAELQDFIKQLQSNSTGKSLLDAIFGNSPFLSKLILRHLKFFKHLCEFGLQEGLNSIHTRMQELRPNLDEPSLMRQLRIAKSEIALLVAIADIAAQWNLEKITNTLSDFAELCLRIVADHLLNQASARQEIQLKDSNHPSHESGLIILGMGKLGAKELNYSSDIDLIIFFDKDKVHYTGKGNLQQCFSKLAMDLVRIMQERTADGYVFRTDLRLRPDPASTSPAMSINGAMTYYETVGQNWERAALIKARPVGGDYDAGHSFLKSIVPFIWRKNLDFAAIADIHSLKRQMDSKTSNHLAIAGHNIKIGIGGIREIEFFVQIHQLIWGGRTLPLRTSPTCVTLQGLVNEGLLDQSKADLLIEAYHFYRMVEHRLQMIHDHQTHTLPESDDGILSLAIFLGFDSIQEFETKLSHYLHEVHEIYRTSFQTSHSLGDEGALVFTGVDNDPATLETISNMGFSNPATVSEIIQGWHRGSRRATRTKRARELITELTPAMLRALADTPNPDSAFLKFDEFLLKLPAGVQLFSLFTINPHLLTILAKIMGSAPSIAEDLSKNPSLLDAALVPEFFTHLPDTHELLHEFSATILHARDHEDEKHLLRRFKSEKMFQAGLQLLDGRISATRASQFLSDLASMLIQRVQAHVEHEFQQQYGTIPGTSLAVVAMGKLGAQELTFGSDLDLIFIYDAPDEDAHSDGERGYNATIYYNRLVPRFINALSSMTKEGRLYEIDTRLRPSGRDGPLAVSVNAFEEYFTDSAWTFEYMALVRGRPLTGDASLRNKIKDIIHRSLTRKREQQAIAKDVLDMRQKVEQQFGTQNPWHIKYTRGGLMDLDFLCQYLLLVHAPANPKILHLSNQEILRALEANSLIDSAMAGDLLNASEFLSSMLTLLRLCNQGVLDELTAPVGLKALLTDSFKEASFDTLRLRLTEVESCVLNYFQQTLPRN